MKALLILGAMIIANTAWATPPSEALGTTWSSEVKFNRGQATLPADRLNEISGIINRAKESGEIDEVKVISWSDGELPPKAASAPNSEVKLAEQRADYLKKYIKSELDVSSVDTFNMAKRANKVQDFLNTPASKLKDHLESTGNAPTKKEDTGLFGMKSKASSALVLVYLK